MEEEGEDKIPRGKKKEDEQRKEKEKEERDKGISGDDDEDTDSQQQQQQQESSANSGAFYSVLNVPSDATEEEIRAAYRRLSLIFHPDKHASFTPSTEGNTAATGGEGGKEGTTGDPQSSPDAASQPDDSQGMQRAAVEQFQRITRAYEVLSDPTQRTIYDLYGEEGLKSKLQVGAVLTSPAEIKEEFERIQREKEEARLRAQLHPKGTVAAIFDASPIFDPYPRTKTGFIGGAGRLRNGSRVSPEQSSSRIGLAQLLDFAPELRQVSLQQSVEVSTHSLAPPFSLFPRETPQQADPLCCRPR